MMAGLDNDMGEQEDDIKESLASEWAKWVGEEYMIHGDGCF